MTFDIALLSKQRCKYLTNPIVFAVQPDRGLNLKIARRNPCCAPSYEQHRDEHYSHVVVMDAYGVGIDYERASLVAHVHQSELLLKPAEQQSEQYAHDGPDG